MNFKNLFLSGIVLGVLGWSCVYENEEDLYSSTSLTSDSISYEEDIKPILETSCYPCHSNSTNATNGFGNFFGKGVTLEGEDNVKTVIAFDNQKGYLIENIKHSDGFSKMSPAGSKLSDAKIELIQKWIDQEFAKDVTVPDTTVVTVYDTVKVIVNVTKIDSVSYKTDIQPVLQANCSGCHSGTSSFGISGLDANVDINTYENVKTLINFDNKKGYLIENVKHSVGFKSMPQGGSKLADSTITKIQNWIDQGLNNN